MKEHILTADAVLSYLTRKGVSNKGIIFYSDLLKLCSKLGPKIEMDHSIIMKEMKISRTVLKNRIIELFDKGVMKVDEDGRLYTPRPEWPVS